MTYKSMIEHIVEREARQALEKILDTCDGLDFGVVDMRSKDKLFQNFVVDFKEFGKPWTYRVIGFINDLGFVTPVAYYTLGGIISQFYCIKTGLPIR